jgi:hypothetical protein
LSQFSSEFNFLSVLSSPITKVDKNPFYVIFFFLYEVHQKQLIGW